MSNKMDKPELVEMHDELGESAVVKGPDGFNLGYIRHRPDIHPEPLSWNAYDRNYKCVMPGLTKDDAETYVRENCGV